MLPVKSEHENSMNNDDKIKKYIVIIQNENHRRPFVIIINSMFKNGMVIFI